VMSQLAGAPVRLQFMRWDEHGWDNFGSAVMVDLRGGIDATGNIIAWDVTSFSSPNFAGSPTHGLIGLEPETPGTSPAQGRTTSEQYNLPNRRMTAKTLPVLGHYFRTSTMRASGVPTAFASEQLSDELAYVAKMDPVAFRTQNVSTTNRDRWLAVLNAAAQAANWKPRVAASNLSRETVVTGRGVAFGTFGSSFGAAVADIEVNKTTGKIVVKHIYVAQDSGLVVNPMGVENQIEGQAVHGTSRALAEEVRFNTSRVTSIDWVTYPILRFKDAPKVTTIIVNRPDLIMTGAGDNVIVQIGPAIANAFFDATGVRMRQAPMTPARVRAVLKAAGLK
jgi:nicotinate dehydrogenase subunit B